MVAGNGWRVTYYPPSTRHLTNFTEMAETKSSKRKSKSKKAEKKESKLSDREVIDIIVDLGRTATPSVKIGQILRDAHGVANVKQLTGKRIGEILVENGAAPKVPSDIDALIKKAATIRKHLVTHKIDIEAKYGLMLTESKIRKLAKYYRREGVLPANWKYEAAERAV